MHTELSFNNTQSQYKYKIGESQATELYTLS